MVGAEQVAGPSTGGRWRILFWGLAAALLALPAVAMQFTREVDWSGGDFLLLGVLFALVGGGVELAVRRSSKRSYRAGAVVAILAGLLTIWVNLAVGMIGSEDNSYNLLFAGVLVLALLGSALASFRARGMARAMAVAAAVQFIAAAIGLSTDVRGGILSALFALPWLLSAGLFRIAARQEGEDAVRR